MLLSSTFGLNKSSGTRRKLEVISPCEFPNWRRMHFESTGHIFYVDAQGFVWPCSGCNRTEKQITHTPYCPHSQRMKTCEQHFCTKMDPVCEYFDEPQWDPVLPITLNDIAADNKYVQYPAIINTKGRLSKANQIVRKMKKGKINVSGPKTTASFTIKSTKEKSGSGYATRASTNVISAKAKVTSCPIVTPASPSPSARTWLLTTQQHDAKPVANSKSNGIAVNQKMHAEEIHGIVMKAPPKLALSTMSPMKKMH